MLTNKYLGGIPADSRVANPHGTLGPDSITEATIAKARDLNEIAASRGQSLAQMALAWVLRHPGMTSALIGASKPSQIADSVGALNNLAFSEAELTAIDEIASR